MSRRKQNRQGASAVEFALVFPLILAIFTAMMVFTQAFLLRDTAQHAAYEGAREAMLLQSSVKDVERAAQDFMKLIRVRSGRVKVSPTQLSTSTEQVTVRVEIPFSDNAWMMGPFLPRNWTMGSSVTLTRQYSGD